MTPEEPRQRHMRFHFISVWQNLKSEDADALRQFWRSQGAFNDDKAIEERLSQVICLARDGTEIAGVCTAVAVTPQAFGQPMYYFRVFTGRAWRTTRLVGSLWMQAREILEVFAGEHGFPCIGILVELENQGFLTKGRRPVWNGLELTYIGKSPRGLETRAYYFKGARLKDPK